MDCKYKVHILKILTVKMLKPLPCLHLGWISFNLIVLLPSLNLLLIFLSLLTSLPSKLRMEIEAWSNLVSCKYSLLSCTVFCDQQRAALAPLYQNGILHPLVEQNPCSCLDLLFAFSWQACAKECPQSLSLTDNDNGGAVTSWGSCGHQFQPLLYFDHFLEQSTIVKVQMSLQIFQLLTSPHMPSLALILRLCK